MRAKSFFVLLAVLAVLAALAVAKKADRERRLRESATQTRFTFLTHKFEDDLVHTVILYKGDVPDDKEIVLSRQEDGWVLVNRNGIPARTDRVKSVIRGIENVRGELRGVSAGVFSDFGIADDEGIHVILKGQDSQEIINLVYGVKVPGPNVAFCRLGGSEETYMVTSGFPKRVGVEDADSELTDDSFVQGRIYSEKVKAAGRIEVAKAGEDAFSLVKAEDGTWAFDPPQRRQEVDTSKVDAFLKVLAGIDGRGLIDVEEGVDYGFEEPAARVVATVSGEGPGSPGVFDIRVGKEAPEKAGMYFVRALPQDIVYYVPQNAAENLLVGRRDFTVSRRKK